MAGGDGGEERPIVFLDDVEFEVGRPAGIKPGTPLELPLAVNSGPLPLEPGGRYEWRLSIDGESDEDWRSPSACDRRKRRSSPAALSGGRRVRPRGSAAPCRAGSSRRGQTSWLAA